MTMVVPLEGGYANLRKFLQAVESSSKFLVIEQVALAQGHEGGAILQLNIALATYFDDPEARASLGYRRRAAKRT
jgi:Tfp pilus assembly protein PilO